MERCNYCTETSNDGSDCPHCKFQYDEEYFPYKNDDWDILNLDDDLEWSHLQILYRLHLNGVECLRADIFTDNNIGILIGVKSDTSTVARVLGIHKECIYNLGDEGLWILNLFQEKYLRGNLNNDNTERFNVFEADGTVFFGDLQDGSYYIGELGNVNVDSLRSIADLLNKMDKKM